MERSFLKVAGYLLQKELTFINSDSAFFVHSEILRNLPNDIIEPEHVMGNAEGLKFRIVAGFLTRAGMEVIYAIPLGNLFPPEDLRWFLYRFDFTKEKLQKINPVTFFDPWERGGRPSHGGEWNERLKQDYLAMEEEELIPFLLNEAFYTTYLKGSYRIKVYDPYDVDGFILSYSSRIVLPLEIKEKFPAIERNNEAFFGIDAGRVLMLLRLCLPNDANAFYVIREVRETDRSFVGWKYTTLAEIITNASWNLQRGGTGMGGQETQTIRLPYHGFKQLEPFILSDSNLEKIGNLPTVVKKLAEEYKKILEREYILPTQGERSGQSSSL